MTLDALPADLTLWTKDDIDDAVAIRRREKCRLELELARLLRKRNNLQPISCLPDDILTVIFLQYHLEVTYSWSPSPGTDRPDWLKLGGVCHRWREILISYSPLWSHLTTTSIAWSELLISRSKQSSLRVFFVYPSGPTFLRIYATVLPQTAWRIRSLEIRIPTNGICAQDPLPSTLTDCPLPSLENLRISGLHHIDSEQWNLALQPLCGDSQSYGNLRTLACQGAPWPFMRGVIRPFLVTLEASCLPDPPSADTWLHVLGNMTQLKELTLDTAVASEGVPETLMRTVYLPQLSTLTLCSSTEHSPILLTLWDHLQHPKLSHVYIDFQPLWDRIPDTTMRGLAAKCSEMNSIQPFVSARLTWSYQVMFALPPSWHYPLPPAIGLSSSAIPAVSSGTARFLDKTSRTFCVSFYNDRSGRPIFDTLPLSHVTTLVVDYAHTAGLLEGTLVEIWEVLGRRMTNVTTLYVSDTKAIMGFLVALRRRAKISVERGRVFEFFSKLEYLVLDDNCWVYVDVDAPADAEDLDGWVGPPGCPCQQPQELQHPNERCSCVSEEDQHCSCEAGVLCDCECRWAKERLGTNKLVIEAFQWHKLTGVSRLRRLDIVATRMKEVNMPQKYGQKVLGDLVENLNIKLVDHCTPVATTVVHDS